MSELELNAVTVAEKPYHPNTSKHECAGALSSQVASQPQSPSLSNTVPDTASSSGSEGKPSSKHGAALETTLQSLQNRAQGLIDKINEERAKDQELMKSFNESLSMKVSEISQRLEDRMYNLYNQHNQLLQERMQELPEVIERIEGAG
uniref:Uncharacterized protein n=1 Tax=Leptobrachium leishanense TaxID=445787 RepID=A0A8C5LP08_9ANUR